MPGGFHAAIGEALNGAGRLPAPTVRDSGNASLPSVFDVSGLATATLGAACAEARALKGQMEGALGIDRHLASEWFNFCLAPVGWDLPPVWDDIAGVYSTGDGHIRLHTNAPHHKAAALSVLACEPTRASVAVRVAEWQGDALETAIVDAGGCAAVLRSAEDWATHPQGRAVASEPLIAWTETGRAAPDGPDLDGVKVLDLTRVLAGPVATRTLAGFGADVLRIDPPGWAEAICEPEVTWGKRLATLDLRTPDGAARLRALLAEADILVHGLRPGALDGLGFDAKARRAINPWLIDIAHNAYGWTGLWSWRRGFDSLVQMSTGIAHAGKVASGGQAPVPLPVQALDYGTGYLIAAAALRALRVRRDTGRVMQARLSLARTAELLKSEGGPGLSGKRQGRSDRDFGATPLDTAWGPARVLRWPGPDPMQWRTGAHPFHSDTADFAPYGGVSQP